MRRSILIRVLWSALVSLAHAQSLFDVLENIPKVSNFTSLLRPFESEYDNLSNFTLLAPSNDAISAWLGTSDAQAWSSPSAQQYWLEYYFMKGSYSNFTRTAFLPTLLNSSSYANLSSGQVIEVNVWEGNGWFLTGVLQNASVITNATAFDGGYIYVIDTVLEVPKTFSETGVAINMTAAVGAFEDTQTIDIVDTASDSTILVPNNEAFKRVGGNLAQLSTTDLDTLIQYHVISNNVLYSTNIQGERSLGSLTGQNVTFRVIDNDIYINNARVLVPDILLRNGVAHVIDAVLNPANASVLPSTSGNSDAFAQPLSASTVPFTSGVPTPTSVLPYEATATLDNDNNNGNTKSGPPVGAIAGGVIAGVAGIALIAGLVWFFMRRKGYKVRLEKKPEQASVKDITNTNSPSEEPQVSKEDAAAADLTRNSTAKSYRKAELDTIERKKQDVFSTAEVVEVHELEPPPKPPAELEAEARPGPDKGKEIDHSTANKAKEIGQLAELE